MSGFHSHAARVAASGALVVVAALVPGRAAAEPSFAAYARPGLNALVSVRDDGGQADSDSYDAQPSADGSLVAFFGNGGLVDGPVHPDGNVYLSDRTSGTMELISVAHDGGAPNGSSSQPAISADGRHVAFVSFATNLVPSDDADGRSGQVYVRDRQLGTTTRITSAVDGGASGGASLGPVLSSDGRLVGFFSHAADLVEGDTNGRADVFLHDRSDGTTRRVSVGFDGSEADGLSAYPAFSGDGRTVAFYSAATNLVPNDENAVRDIFAADLASGQIELVSVATDGTQGNYDSFSPVISLSHDGSFVAFQSGASNFVPIDTNGLESGAINGYDVFVRDRLAGTTERVSVGPSGQELRKSLGPWISADGRYVAFDSIKPGEDPASFVAANDVFVHDRLTHATELISATPRFRTPGSGDSVNARLSSDGRHAVFQSSAPDLVPGDGNERVDIVARDRGPEVGVLELDAEPARDFPGQNVGGLMTVSGVLLAGADDPEEPAAGSGADLRRATVTYRPEDGDLLVRLQVTSLPRVSTGVPGAPDVPAAGVVHGLRFRLDGVPYELRASRAGATADTPATPAFRLYRCQAKCTQVATPDGGWGTAGDEIRIGLPLPPLGLEDGEGLTELTAFTSSGDGTTVTPTSAEAFLDGIALGDITLPAISVQLGAAPAGTSAADVVFDTAAGHLRGSFSGQLEGTEEAWARVCVGAVCGPPARAGGAPPDDGGEEPPPDDDEGEEPPPDDDEGEEPPPDDHEDDGQSPPAQDDEDDQGDGDGDVDGADGGSGDDSSGVEDAEQEEVSPRPADPEPSDHPDEPRDGGEVLRLSGDDRIATAAAIALHGRATAETVVLARADAYADALAGAPLAAKLGAPVLLTASDRLSAAAADAIAVLGARSAVLLGGTAALAPEVAAALEADGVAVHRIAGADRYSTAVAIADELGAAGEYLLAEGAHADPARGWPDALSASALGASAGTAVLLTGAAELPAVTAARIGTGEAVTVVGGVAAISDDVADQLRGRGVAVRRIAGTTRYGTSAAVADEAVRRGATAATTWVASGLAFPDGLVASAAAGGVGGVLLLVDGQDLDASAESAAWLQERAPAVRELRISGGRSAISADVEAALRNLLG